MSRPYTIRPAITVIGPSIAYIDLLNGVYALIDAEDADWLSEYAWNAMWSPTTKSYYAGRMGRLGEKRTVYMHRAILRCIGKMTGDHRNATATLDNRRCNLRHATQSQNSTNRRKRSDNLSGVVGVSRRENGKWRARITVDRKLINLGDYGTREEAIEVRQKAVQLYHGEFTQTLSLALLDPKLNTKQFLLDPLFCSIQEPQPRA